MAFFQEQLFELRQLVTRSALQAELFSFVVNAQPYADVVQHCRDNGSLNNIKVRNAYKLCHQEGSSAHNRRHQLTAGRSSSLNSTRKCRTITELFHHRDGESAGAGNVTNGAAGNSTHEAGGQYGNLRRSACCPACDCVGNINEEFAQTGGFQVSTKENEQINKGRRYTHRRTENTLGSEEQMVKHFLHANAAMRQNTGNVRT